MRSLAIAALLVLTACPGPDSQVEGAADPAGLGPPPGSAALTGTYQVTSSFEVPATVAAPGPLGESLSLLHELSVNPAGGILDLADAAGAPALGTLRLVLPSTLQDRLEGWMNDYLEAATVNGGSPHERIVALDDRIRSVLLDWDLRSTLDLPSRGAGSHTPVAFVFSASGAPVVVPVEETAPVTGAGGVRATVTWPASGPPVVAVGDHAMGVPFGHYARIGIDAVLSRELGTPGIEAALRAAIDCAGLARSVASQCLGFLCLGHEAEVRDVCAAGVAEAAERLEGRILAIDYQAIHFVSGTATVEGVTRDAAAGTASAEALSAGTWDATIDVAQEPEVASAHFTAVR